MIIQLSEREQNNLQIKLRDRPVLNAAYLEEREQVWAGQMEKVLARGGNMWNGEIYTLEDLVLPEADQVRLKMSTCEYKDIVFRLVKGREHVAERYGEEYLFRFTGVSCVPVTEDGKFVFGIRADRPEQGAPVGGIGGTLNKDEMEIHTFADIRQCMLGELQEETALPFAPERLKFFGILCAKFSYLFFFTIKLPVHSGEVNRYHRPGEFSSLVALTQDEALSTTLNTTPAVRMLRQYLHALPSVFDKAES